MDQQPAAAQQSLVPLPPTPPAQTALKHPPQIWGQLDPLHQRQLAQLLADLIRRRYCPPHQMEDNHDADRST